MVTWGRAGAAGELQQDQLAAQQFAFLGGPWETHAQETEKATTAVSQALPQAAQAKSSVSASKSAVSFLGFLMVNFLSGFKIEGVV